MLRKKKLRKLGKIPKPVKSRKQTEYEQMLNQISVNVKSRRRNKVLKEQERQEWLQSRAASFVLTNQEVSKDWAKGSTKKTSVFNPESIKHIDVDEVNARRKEAGIETTIQEGIEEAKEEAIAKSKRVALAYSKGAYQYLGKDKQTLKDLGKKTSQLEQE